jgi:putative drug exporter of the RND superfamily
MQLHDRLEATRLQTAGPEHISSLETHGLYRLGLRYGRQIYRLRWLIIAAWAVLVLVSVPFAAQIGSVLTGGGLTSSTSESARAGAIIQDTLHQPNTQLLVVFHSTATVVSAPGYQQEVNAFLNRARSFPNVISAVAATGSGQDGRTTYVTVNFRVGPGTVENQLSDFRRLLPGQSAANPARASLTGEAPFDEAFTQLTLQETERAELFALPLALLVLVLVFGTLVAAAMPILLALVAIPVTLAIIYGIGLHLSMSDFVLNITSIIGLGIAIDYSLFMIRRFRDELAGGRSMDEAVAWTIATSGISLLFSGLIVMIGFCGLLLIGSPIMSSLGIGGAVVVATALLAALTLLPALLGVLDDHINSLRLRWLSRLARREQASAAKAGAGSQGRRSFWQRWAWAVMKRPLVVIGTVLALLAAMAWPVFSLSLGTTSSSAIPNSFEARQGLDILNAEFPETRQQVVSVVVQTSDGSSMLTPGNLATLDRLTQWIVGQAHGADVVGLTRVPATAGAPPLSEQQLVTLYITGAYQHDPQLAQLVAATTSGKTTLISVATHASMGSSASKALVSAIRAGDRAEAGGFTVLVGGEQATSLDFTASLYSAFPWAILFILGATYVLLLTMFRSVLLPLKAVLMNVLSVSACLGVLVFIFQWGNLSAPLGFTSAGYLDNVIPILLFCILFGLSMDYEVFLLSRIREEWFLTHYNSWAVARGLEKTGGVITSAALLFVIVAGAFIFTSLVVTKEMGLGMAIAVLVDATVIRVLLVPATMRLLGRWNWWLPGMPPPPRQHE